MFQPKGFREWLTNESAQWADKGFISIDQRTRILNHYPIEESSVNWMAFILRVFAILLFGAALMLVVGHNWENLSREMRLTTVVVGVILLHSVGLWYMFQARRTGSVLGHLAGCIMFGAGIALVGQTYHMDAHSPDAVFAWCLGTLPFALALESKLLHIASIALASIWFVMEKSHTHSEFITNYHFTGIRVVFLLLLLPSAFAAYRLRSPIVLGTLAWALMANWFVYSKGIPVAAFTFPLAIAALHTSGNPYGHGFRFIGAFGVVVLTLFLGSLKLTNDLYSSNLWGDPILLGLTLLAALLAIRNGHYNKDSSQTWPAYICLGTLALGFFHGSDMLSVFGHSARISLANILTLATAIWLVRTGLFERRLRPYVYGALIFLAWLSARYIDIDSNFGMLGTAGFFATIGAILFLLARLWRSHQEKALNREVRAWHLPGLEIAFSAISSRSRLIVLAFSILQACSLIWMAWHHGRPAVTGQQYWLNCQAVDPRDLMRGDYVILNYTFSNPTKDDEARLRKEWAELNSIDLKSVDEAYDLYKLPNDTVIYVPLTVDAKGVAKGNSPTLIRPKSGPFLRGYTGYRRFGQFRFGIEAFYVKEGTGMKWENLRNQGLLRAKIGVLSDGRAGLIELSEVN